MAQTHARPHEVHSSTLGGGVRESKCAAVPDGADAAAGEERKQPPSRWHAARSGRTGFRRVCFGVAAGDEGVGGSDGFGGADALLCRDEGGLGGRGRGDCC